MAFLRLSARPSSEASPDTTGCLVQTSDGMYWRYALNGEVCLLTREEEELANLHFAVWDRTEAID